MQKYYSGIKCSTSLIETTINDWIHYMINMNTANVDVFLQTARINPNFWRYDSAQQRIIITYITNIPIFICVGVCRKC